MSGGPRYVWSRPYAHGGTVSGVCIDEEDAYWLATCGYTVERRDWCLEHPREPMDAGVQFSLFADLAHRGHQEFLNRAKVEMLDYITRLGPPLKKPTRVQRALRRIRELGARVRDAWLVLIGRREID